MSTKPSVIVGLFFVCSGCVFDRQLGETADEQRAESLQLECEEAQADPPEPEPPWWYTEPSDIAPCVPVVDLTAAQKTAWCEWYEASYDEDGAPAPSTSWIEDGAVVGGATRASGLPPEPMPICIQQISAEHCVANLSLDTCAAPLIVIERCVRGLSEARDEALLETCRDLLGLDGCERTIVQQQDFHVSCPVPIE